MNLDPSFPVQELLFFVAHDLTASIRAGVYNLVANLATSRKWVIGPPKFVDIAEGLDEAAKSDGEIPFETVGGALEIYSSMPPTVLPREVDLQHLEEVSALILAVCDFSRAYKVTFEFELDGDCVGDIENGEMDTCLRQGLLGEWKRNLGISD